MDVDDARFPLRPSCHSCFGLLESIGLGGFAANVALEPWSVYSTGMSGGPLHSKLCQHVSHAARVGQGVFSTYCLVGCCHWTRPKR